MPSPHPAAVDDRRYWVQVAERLATPVLTALARGELKKVMPVYCRPGEEGLRRQFTHLEALARTLCGIGPWLECGGLSGEETGVRDRLAGLAREAIAAGTDPQSPDYLNFTYERQPVVDGAFLAHALLRAPRVLWEPLPAKVKANVLAGLRAVRGRRAVFNNWLLFCAMVEAGIHQAGASDWDCMRVDYALRQHQQWYIGDGHYKDGPNFHFDYYNSYVIHPMMVDILLHFRGVDPDWDKMVETVLARATRFAAIQERMIAPDGTFPPVGRSLVYRMGAFQALAQAALQGRLPGGVSPGQVRGAMTAVMKRCMEAPGTFDAQGFLTIGLAGNQPDLAEGYISTGSLYLCSAALLPLGLGADHAFWTDAPAPWTSKRVWGGENVPADHSLHEGK